MLINMNGKVCLLFHEKKREDCCAIVVYVNLFICTGNLLKRKHCVWQSCKFVDIACSLFTVHRLWILSNNKQTFHINEVLTELCLGHLWIMTAIVLDTCRKYLWIFSEGRCSFYTVHHLKVYNRCRIFPPQKKDYFDCQKPFFFVELKHIFPHFCGLYILTSGDCGLRYNKWKRSLSKHGESFNQIHCNFGTDPWIIICSDR